ncbi:unnamed protein product [Camellia sinensis]
MEGASSSLRSNNSTMWRNTGVEIFSRSSSRAEEDEEALKWAALERLPTFNRLKKGLLQDSVGVANEVDLLKLGFQERKNLMERLVRIAEEDNEKFLFKLKNRIESDSEEEEGKGGEKEKLGGGDDIDGSLKLSFDSYFRGLPFFFTNKPPPPPPTTPSPPVVY